MREREKKEWLVAATANSRDRGKTGLLWVWWGGRRERRGKKRRKRKEKEKMKRKEKKKESF